MRLLIVATVFTAVFSGSAFAQSTYTHNNWCLMVGSAQECAYQTLGACKAGKQYPTDGACFLPRR